MLSSAITLFADPRIALTIPVKVVVSDRLLLFAPSLGRTKPIFVSISTICLFQYNHIKTPRQFPVIPGESRETAESRELLMEFNIVQDTWVLISITPCIAIVTIEIGNYYHYYADIIHYPNLYYFACISNRRNIE